MRRGKFILFRFDHKGWMAINPKLSGRLQLSQPERKATSSTLMRLTFDGLDLELRYLDDKRMGQVYLTRDLAQVPTFTEMGPEVSMLDLAGFKLRLRRFRGEIKGVLTRESLVAGIGNAYADEILWHARLHPYRKSNSLTADEIESLYRAIRTTLLEAGHLAREAMGESTHLKPRDFFQVHLRGGEACSRCGTTVSEIRARRRITSFCRNCQPGGLIRGMN
jgi:formamidopyrimidine-DNA glycosylase